MYSSTASPLDLEVVLANEPTTKMAKISKSMKNLFIVPSLDDLSYQDKTLICGVALGYEDTEAPINNYRTPRENIDSFTRYYS